MPEYLAPGVYVEETSFRAKSIEGVGTSTTAFVGPARSGPVGVRSELITSLPDFERSYGGLAGLGFADAAGNNPSLNFLAHAVRAYFDNGGSRLYVVRTLGAGATSASAALLLTGTPPAAPADAAERVTAHARYPGASGNGRLSLRQSVRPAPQRTLDTAPVGSLARLNTGTEEVPNFSLYVKTATGWVLRGAAASTAAASLPAGSVSLLSLSVEFVDGDGLVQVWDDIGFGPDHPRALGTVLAEHPGNRSDDLLNRVWIEVGSGVSAFELQAAVAAANGTAFTLAGGLDGGAPALGAATQAGSYAQGLAELLTLEDVAIVAAPGSSAYGEAQAVQNALIGHAETRRAYRIAV
ncbi:MAG: hypothetical protein RJA44_2749, partial [Pseudomonadota bacterium]